MELSPYILNWLTALLRWAHVFFAITWVGNSYLFNYLDNKLKKNLKNEEIDADGILQHSGYYYRLTRFHGAPKTVPKNLIIFKWQSYLTFITGMLLLIVIYYVNSKILMIDQRVNANITPSIAIIISIFSIVISWFIYDLICKSKLINYKIIFFYCITYYWCCYFIWFNKNLWATICISVRRDYFGLYNVF